MNNKLYIAMYHYTRDLAGSRYPNIKGMDIGEFRKQMSFFKENYHVIRMEQLLDAVSGGAPLPENAVLLTFDDGYVDHYLYALPVLEEFGFQGSFFVPGKACKERKLLDVNKIHYLLACGDIREIYSDVLKQLDHYRGQEFDYHDNEELIAEYAVANRFDLKETIFVKRILQTALPEELRGMISSKLFQKYVGVSEETLAKELYLTLDQIRELQQRGMFIGTHGYAHDWLGNLPVQQMQKDIEDALDVMDAFIDRNRWVVNYPYGSYNEAVLDYVRQKGAVLGITTKVQMADLATDDPLTLPRLDCNDFPPKSDNYKEFG